MCSIRCNNLALLLALVFTACEKQQIEVVPEEVTALFKTAETGDAQSQYELGLAFHNGENVKQDYFEAARWFRLAAIQGHAESQFLLGTFLSDGTYAATSGSEGENWAAGFLWMKRAADLGHLKAQSQVAYMYRKGKGTSKNLKLSFEYQQRAARQGEPEALFTLGWLYENGEGCEINTSEALTHYYRAAKLRDPAAQYYLGFLYSTGHLVEPDMIIAHRYYQSAQRNGDTRAPKALEDLEQKMTADEIGIATFQDSSPK